MNKRKSGLDCTDSGTHKEIIAKLDNFAPKCRNCCGQMGDSETSLVKKIIKSQLSFINSKSSNLRPPIYMSLIKYNFNKNKINFISQNFDSNKTLTILDERIQATFLLASNTKLEVMKNVFFLYIKTIVEQK